MICLLTKRDCPTELGDYRPEYLAVQTKHSEIRTKKEDPEPRFSKVLKPFLHWVALQNRKLRDYRAVLFKHS